ncbi:helix-turn-helix domain-containing protein [Paraburkholderia sp. J41]|uniref:helix-turn-helix domain-containing protein n=1 Tax=Paraburkholderia sp. J41 TaxID=2805433 RepID=UPI002AC34B42|nr:helix-turn-helix domain-containing protein [Paraburkholderia sp. J41]
MSLTKQPVPYVRFDSNDVETIDRMDYWRASLGNVADLSLPEHHHAAGFEATNEMWMMSEMLMSRRRCADHILHRSARAIRMDQCDHLKVHLRLTRTAQTLLEAGSRQFRLAAGECVITDMARPEWVHVERGISIAMVFPREKLEALLPRAVDLHGVVIRGAAGALLSDHLMSITGRIHAMTRGELPGVSAATLHLIAAGLAPSLDTLALAKSTLEGTLLRRMRRFIDVNLKHHGLNADALCRAFGVSRATLYRLFEPLGGVAHYVRERRLLSVHAELAQAHRSPYLVRIAEEHGFKSAAHFSRAFKTQFGYTPSDLVRSVPRAPVFAAIPGGRFSLPHWLASLR